jgi:hypothetical protein
MMFLVFEFPYDLLRFFMIFLLEVGVIIYYILVFELFFVTVCFLVIGEFPNTASTRFDHFQDI